MFVFGQVSDKMTFEQIYDANIHSNSNSISVNYNISKGNSALLLTSDSPKQFISYEYGLTPFWSSNKITLFDAPVDGDVPSHPPKKELHKRIIQMPAFRKPIREQRCIIPADYVIVHEDEMAFLFYLSTGRPFAVGGVYDHWKLTIKDEVLSSGFCPISLPQIYFSDIKINRFPLIIDSRNVNKWLNKDAPLNDVSNLLNFYPGEQIIGYRVDSKPILKRMNDQRVTNQIGEQFFVQQQDDKGILSYIKTLRQKA